ncbi:cation-translocating P-type ATPase [Chitinophaga vietnamensis]|uniref:cation-translocating P-type ATPase n=1 Tax=Chitinophaga vietnamensis TaxID=2593957 RepID=UPI0011787A66|nr:cation-translocating P-type ATPase [Chitinophaga vietnamensis]
MNQSNSIQDIKNYTGLEEAAVAGLRQLYGWNILKSGKRRFLPVLAGIFGDPMLILLLTACLLYFILGNNTEGWMMLIATLLVSAISLYQEARSKRALEALRQYTAPLSTVIRDGVEKTIPSVELVPGDILLLNEGHQIPADARILSANDLAVNESVISGEALPVDKDALPGNNLLYQGATIDRGKCIVSVTATGNQTTLGKLGKAIETISQQSTLLQQQVNNTVRRLTLFGVLAFVVICLLHYIRSHHLPESILLGLTLAMAAIPEEIPVAFSSFMAMGAFYMSKIGIITRQPQTIEYLGAVSVLCLDKTGTLTENRMTVTTVYNHVTGTLTDIEQTLQQHSIPVLYYAFLASEHDPFDSMEKAIISAYKTQSGVHDSQPAMIYEYPLEGRPPMMTHIYPSEKGRIAAAKGAPERILQACGISGDTALRLQHILQQMTSGGQRVLGVASARPDEGALPQHQDQFNWHFEGFVSLYDPPKANAAAAIERLYATGVNIKLITGDHQATATDIARKTGILDGANVKTGEEIMTMDEDRFKEIVHRVNVFARMFPDAKLKVINALKQSGETVAMTGDGVNDGPALKAADIGIAMGKKGTEIARLAAALIITDDNLEKIPEAILQGRKIYSNLKKAIRYIISIHIPVILTAILPLILNWKYPVIFTPIHIIFLELIMGPTCSIFFEREPVDAEVLRSPANKRTDSLFGAGELLITVTLGLTVTAAVLIVYYYTMQQASIATTRTMVFTILLISNIFLTFTNRSFAENIFHTVRYKNRLTPVILLASVLFLAGLLLLPAARALFGLAAIDLPSFLLCLAVSMAGTLWFEVYKYH